jgi:hypothetical protein
MCLPLDMSILLIQRRMTIGWVEEFVRDGEVVDGFKDC